VISLDQAGRIILVYQGVPGPTGAPIRVTCTTRRAAKSALTRLKKRHGEPEYITGMEHL
jgi:hypothetical protein